MPFPSPAAYAVSTGKRSPSNSSPMAAGGMRKRASRTFSPGVGWLEEGKAHEQGNEVAPGVGRSFNFSGSFTPGMVQPSLAYSNASAALAALPAQCQDVPYFLSNNVLWNKIPTLILKGRSKKKRYFLMERERSLLCVVLPVDLLQTLLLLSPSKW